MTSPTPPTRRDFRARAFELAETVFKLYPKLAKVGPAHAHLAGQLLRAATGIGSNLEEGAVAASRRDMAAKYTISLREAREANYWSRLGATDKNWTAELAPIVQETHEFISMLTVSVRKLRNPILGAAGVTACVAAGVLYFFASYFLNLLLPSRF